jgi:L-iditol 2-dehydrogenase
MMRSVTLRAPGELSLDTIPVPEPGPGELLIQVRAATTCGTDLKAWRRGHPQIPMPGPLGHEYSGDIAAVGTGAKFDVGDPVMGVHSAPCGECRWCQADQPNLCESIMETKVLGAYAEYLLVPARIANVNAYRKPEKLPYAEAALLEPLACVAQGILEIQRILRDQTGSVLVIGPGAIGLMFGAMLKQVGWDVTVAGRNPERLAIGNAMGIPSVPLTDLQMVPDGYDVVIECTGQVEVWEKSIDYVRRGGLLMLFGGPPGGTQASFNTHRLHYDQITLLSPFHFGPPAVRKAYEALAAGLDLSPLISGVRPLEEAAATFEDLAAGRGIKYVFQP